KHYENSMTPTSWNHAPMDVTADGVSSTPASTNSSTTSPPRIQTSTLYTPEAGTVLLARYRSGENCVATLLFAARQDVNQHSDNDQSQENSKDNIGHGWLEGICGPD